MIESFVFGKDFLLSSKEDQVGVFDQDFNQVFAKARAISAEVYPESKLMEHPVESGATITDHIVRLPIEIELTLILSSDLYSDVYYQIFENYRNGRILTVQTKAATYDNMVIMSIPHEENPNMFDHISLGLRLRQVILVEAKYGAAPKVKPKDTKRNTTVDRGQIQTTKPTPQQDQQSKSYLEAQFPRR